MPRIQTNPTQLSRACAALGLPDDTSTQLVNYLENERLERRNDLLRRATGEAAPALRVGRPGWHPGVRHLREELRQHLRDIERSRVNFSLRYGQQFVAPNSAAPRISGAEAYDMYVAQITRLYESMGERLSAAGFLDNSLVDKHRADLNTFIANERAEGRHAGLAHWSQWEDPKIVRGFRRMFDTLYTEHAAANGKERLRKMVPYFNASAQARTYTAWQQAFAAAFGWTPYVAPVTLDTTMDSAATNAAPSPHDSAQPVRMVDRAADYFSRAEDVSEEARAAVLGYCTFVTSAGFKRACDDAAQQNAHKNHTPPYLRDARTGAVVPCPWRKLDNEALLRLHTHVLDVEQSGIGAGPRDTLRYMGLPLPDTQTEIDSRRLAAKEY